MAAGGSPLTPRGRGATSQIFERRLSRVHGCFKQDISVPFKLAACATVAGGSAQRAGPAQGFCARCSRFGYHMDVPRLPVWLVDLLEPMVGARLKQEGTGSVRFVSVPSFSKNHRFSCLEVGHEVARTQTKQGRSDRATQQAPRWRSKKRQTPVRVRRANRLTIPAASKRASEHGQFSKAQSGKTGPAPGML